MATQDSTYLNQVGFAPEIAPYGQNLLGMAAASIYDYQMEDKKDANGNPVLGPDGKPIQVPVVDAKGMPVIAGLKEVPQYEGDRQAQFTDLQKQAFAGAKDLGVNAASQASATGLEGLATKLQDLKYDPTKATNQFTAPKDLGYTAKEATAAQMGPAERVNTQSFAQPGSADAYMSPYMQNVVERQKREAARQSGIQGTQQQAQAAQAGAFGGGRDAIMRAERERNLSQQMGDIQATGSQAAYQQAQQQFNAEQQARLQAQQANQQAGLTVGTQNLTAAQQANLANANAANTAAQFGAGQGLTAAQTEAQYGQAANQLSEQSKQFGAGQGLAALQAAGQTNAALGAQGQNIYNQGVNNLGIQNTMGTQQQQNVQNMLTQNYTDFQNEVNAPYKQLGFMSDVVRGAPTSVQGTTITTPAPSLLNQVAGAGTALYGLTQPTTPKARGGAIKQRKINGLPALLINSMARG